MARGESGQTTASALSLLFNNNCKTEIHFATSDTAKLHLGCPARLPPPLLIRHLYFTPHPFLESHKRDVQTAPHLSHTPHAQAVLLFSASLSLHTSSQVMPPRRRARKTTTGAAGTSRAGVFATLTLLVVSVALLSLASPAAAQFDGGARSRNLGDETAPPAKEEANTKAAAINSSNNSSGKDSSPPAASQTPNPTLTPDTPSPTSSTSAPPRGETATPAAAAAVEEEDSLLSVRESRVLPRELHARVRAAAGELTAAGLGPLAAAAVDSYGGGERVRAGGAGEGL